MGTFDAKAFYRKKKEEENKTNSSSSVKTTSSGFDAKGFYNKAKANEVINFDTFESDLSTLSTNITNIYNGWQTPETMKNTLSSVQSMYDRLNKYQEYQKSYGGTDLSDVLNSYKTVIDDWDSLSSNYGKYKDEKTYTNEKNKLKELNSMTAKDVEAYLKDKSNPIAYTTVDGQNITWKKLYDTKSYEETHSKLYADATSKNDFEKYRKIGAEVKNPSAKDVEWQSGFKWFYPNREKPINQISYALDNKLDMSMAMANGYEPDEGNIRYSLATEQEKALYDYYLGQELEGVAEKGTADAYLKSIYDVLDTRYGEDTLEGTARVADKLPLISSALSVLATPISAGQEIKNKINYLKTGESQINYAEEQKNILRGGLSQKVDLNIGDFDVFDFVYNTGMSGADSLFAISMLGPLGGGATLGLSASASATNDALKRGMDDSMAFRTGVEAGLAEWIFESISIGNFKALKEAPVDGYKSILKNLKKSAIVNASEETFTEIANIAYDTIANGDFSQYQTKVNSYISQGMSESDAKKAVAKETAGQIVEAAASGGLMGVGFGVLSQAPAYSQTKQTGQAIKANERTTDMLNLAANLTPEESSAYEAYTRYANKGINADNITDAQLGNLYTNARLDAQKTLDSKKSTKEQKAAAEKTISDLDVYAQYNPEARISKKAIKQKYDAEVVDGLIAEGLESGENTSSFKLATEYKTKLEKGKKLTVDEISRLVEANESAFKDEGRKSVTERLVELGESSDIADIVTRKLNGEIITQNEMQAIKDSKYGNQVLLENTNEEITSIADTMGKADAELFMRLYDGTTDADAYANAFELVKSYAKSPKSFSVDYALENKGVLSATQASEIYNDVVIREAALKKAEDKLRAEARMSHGANGNIDDSIINYGKNPIEGKVNWNSLSDRQRESLVFVNGLMKGLNSNLTIVGKNKKFNGAYEVGSDTIFVDAYAGVNLETLMGNDFIIPTASHELTHKMEVYSPELFDKVTDIVLKSLEENSRLSSRDRIAREIDRLDKNHPEQKHTEKDAISEIVARACEDMLSVSEEGKKIFNSLSESEQKTFVDMIKEIIQTITDWIDELLKSYKSNSEEAKILRADKETFEKVSKYWDMMLADVAAQNKARKESGENEHKTTVENRVLEQARELQRKEPTKLTENDFKNLLKFAKEKFFADNTYIPARINTPQILIAFAKEQGFVLENHPLAMSVYKVRQALSNELEWDGRPSDKPHDLTEEEVVEIVKAMNNPSYLVYQTQNDRFAEIVKFEKDGEKNKAYAIIDFFDVDKNPEYMNGYEGGKYNILVTIYPSSSQNELNDYLKNKNNIVITGEEMKKKAISQRGSGSYVPSHLNDMAFYEDIVPNSNDKVNENSSNKDIRYADRDDNGYAKAREIQTEISQLSVKIADIEESEEYSNAMDDFLKSMDAYAFSKYLEESGYNKAKERMNELQTELGELQSKLKTERELKAANEERKAIEKSGLSEADYFRKQAVKEFGYTPYFYDAGYITPNGRMLNFSGEKGMHYGSRGQDHRAIGIVYANVDGSKAMVKFMNEGNIRIMAESPGIDLSSSVEPSKEQYATIRKFVREYANREYFNIDITDAEGHTVGNYEYEGKISAERVVNDIKYFFENGATREQSSISQFLYSDRDTDYLKAVESGDTETASRMVEEAAEKAFSNSKVRDNNGKLRLVYHGTVNDFTVFNRQFANIEGDFGKGYYFTSNEYDVDANYANEEGPDLKNKIARLAERLEWDDEYADLSYEEREEIARQRLVTSEPTTITAYLNMENPVYITPDESGTFLDFNEEYDEEYDEYGEPEGLLVDFIEALNNNASDYSFRDVDFNFLYEYAESGGVFAADAVKIIKNRIVDELTDENGDLAVNEVIRLAFEEIGFDGIIDTSVYYKFRTMDGMDSGTTHYIVFDSNQIKSADVATYDDNGNVIPLSQRFNAGNDDIRYSDRGATLTEEEYKANCSKLVQMDFVAELIGTELDGKLPLKQKISDLFESWGNSIATKRFGDVALTNSSIHSEFRHGTTRNKVTAYAAIPSVLKSGVVIDVQKKNHGEVERIIVAAPISIANIPYFMGVMIQRDSNTNRLYLHDVVIKKEVSEYQAEHLNTTGPVETENLLMTDVLEKAISVGYSVSHQSGKVKYSDRDDTSVYDIMGETERIKKENAKFKEEIERLNERLKLERQVTHGNYFNENQLGSVAGHLRNISRSNMDKGKLMASLKDVYSFIAHSPQLTWEEVFMKCYRIADAMVAESKPAIVVDDYYKQILKHIKNTKISLSESQKQEAASIFDKNWNRYFFGRTTITDSGTPIDTMWQEWSSMYPDVFKDDISDGDMIGELYDIINRLQDASEVVVEYDKVEQTRWLANEIYNQYWNVSPIRTTADKYDKKIKLLNFEHRRAMAELRDDYKARTDKKVKNQKLADKKYYGKLLENLKSRKEQEVARAKQLGKERIDKYKENAERKTSIQRITANALSMNEMLVKNSKDKHIPEIMKGPVTALIQAIDFSSKRMIDKGEPTQKDISLSKALGKVKDMMVKATNAHDELVELYGHGLDEDIEKMVDSVDTIMRTVGDNEFVLNKMELADLQTLDKMVKTIKHAVNKLNKFHTVNHARGIANLSKESMEYLDRLGNDKIYDGFRGKVKKLLNWGNALPYYVFKRYGSGGMKVYEALQDGWDKFAFNVKKIIDYANEAYTSKEVNEWSKDIKTFKILVPASEFDLANKNYKPQYQEVKLTVPQIMSMYCLSKREQAKGHLFKGGIRVADFKDKKGNIVSQSEGVIFTEKDVQTIFNSLTERQRTVADKLQRFMNTTCADWGNDVSMARFGYKAFGEENYFPIQSDKNNLAVNDETEQANSLFKLLNMSFTKSTIDNANNRIVISDIFDVFAQHTSDMAKYNSLALPVLDSFKWYNYTEKQDVAEGTFKTLGVKQSIEKAFGKDGQIYFTTFLKDINGQQEVSRDTLGGGFFKKAKIAAVGANLRVMLLQPTSYVRASAVIDNKYLAKALIHKPKIEKAETHCGIALWKSMGYYDTNVQKGVEAQIKHSDTWKDKAVEFSMKGAEIADKVTWGYLWNACELEVRDTRKDLKVGSNEFYEAISKRLREVIYATQVVDSTMTRSQMMRSTDRLDKMLTAFASEPTLSYNMVQDAYMEYHLDQRQVGKREAIKKNSKRIARILTAYTMTNAFAALIESAFDAFRDDDDEEKDLLTFMKTYYLPNILSDMSITAKIPYVKEIHSFIKGFGSSRTDTQWMENITKAFTTFYKLSTTGKGNASTVIKYSIKSLSDVSGLPLYNVYRDTMATLKSLDLFTAEDLNEMFKDFLN